VYWAVLTLGPVLIGTSLSITSFLVGSSLGMLDLGEFAKAALGLLTFLFTCAALTMLYLVVPFRRIELRHALAGGIVAGVIFEFAKRGFALFVANFPTHTLIYGAFAAIPIFLIWLYLSWVVVLFGATLTAMLPAWRAEHALRADAPGGELLDALAVLRVLARAPGALSVGGIASQAGLTPERCERVLERCATLGWTARTDRESWLLAVDTGAIRVADVVGAFAIDIESLRAQAPRALAEHFERAGETLTMTLKDIAAEETPA
jgi:membrane protein